MKDGNPVFVKNGVGMELGIFEIEGLHRIDRDTLESRCRYSHKDPSTPWAPTWRNAGKSVRNGPLLR